MKRLFTTILILSLAFSQAFAGNHLKFGKDGKFKILQLTDIHYIWNDSRCNGVLESIKEMIEAEEPDLVVVTGDLIYGDPGKESMECVLEMLNSCNVPFAVTWGNHDDEHGLSRAELLELAQGYKHNVSSTTGGIHGVTNYCLEIASSKSKKPAEIVWIFDSNSYCPMENVKGYDWIHNDQIQWYRNTSAEYTAANGGEPVPSVAFFHIPLLEYESAIIKKGARFTGTKAEDGGFPRINSGLFVSFQEMGDVKAVFAGHDHNNDFIANYYGIALAYGRYSGGDTVYNDIKPNGCRVIELTEGTDSFRTYIRIRGGAILHDVIFPDFLLFKGEN